MSVVSGRVGRDLVNCLQEELAKRARRSTNLGFFERDARSLYPPLVYPGREQRQVSLF
jgi:hypothetical protein